MSSHIAQTPEGQSRVWENDQPPTVGEDQLRNLKVRESMGPDQMHPWVLRGLVDELAMIHHV